jgi:hypothetical protein
MVIPVAFLEYQSDGSIEMSWFQERYLVDCFQTHRSGYPNEWCVDQECEPLLVWPVAIRSSHMCKWS